MIKTFENKAAHDAASKSEMESTLVLIENINDVVVDGVNVLTEDPKKGDILIKDEKGEYRFIAYGTFSAGVFPDAWETIGVVALRKGNQVTIVSKGATTAKWMDVYPYVVTGYVLDGQEHSATLKLHGSAVFTFTYTCATDAEFLTALQGFLVTNGFTDWSTYIQDEKVILQYNNYTSAEYITANITQFTGDITLTSKCALDIPSTAPTPYIKGGIKNSTYVWHYEKALEYFSQDLTNTAYNPTTEKTGISSYPVCFPAFCGTSAHRKDESGNQLDYCSALRALYCADVDNPTHEEWETYMADLVPIAPIMKGGFAPINKGREITDRVKDIMYLATDGTYKPLYAAFAYAASFMNGKGFFPSEPEFFEIGKSWTYGLSGVTRATADPVNRSLYAIGGNACSCASYWWLSGRPGAAGAWIAYSLGNRGNGAFYHAFRVCPLSLLTLPLGNN